MPHSSCIGARRPLYPTHQGCSRFWETSGRRTSISAASSCWASVPTVWATSPSCRASVTTWGLAWACLLKSCSVRSASYRRILHCRVVQIADRLRMGFLRIHSSHHGKRVAPRSLNSRAPHNPGAQPQVRLRSDYPYYCTSGTKHKFAWLRHGLSQAIDEGGVWQ